MPGRGKKASLRGALFQPLRGGAALRQPTLVTGNKLTCAKNVIVLFDENELVRSDEEVDKGNRGQAGFV